METIKEMEELLPDSQLAAPRHPLRRTVSWTRRSMPACRIRPFVLLAVLILVTAQVTLFSGEVKIHHHTASSEGNSTTAPSENNWFPILDPIGDGRIIVTGGGGNIGLPVLQRLLSAATPVTVLDKTFHDEELDKIYANYPQAKSLLRVQLGDIRDADALKAVMTPGVVGVVHLAAISRVHWCSENEVECMDVNERGTEAVMAALRDLNAKDGGSRWLLLASSSIVYGDPQTLPVMEDAETAPTSSFGASMLKAEGAVQQGLSGIEEDQQAGSLHAAILRLSHVYGGLHDHSDRLIPSIIAEASSHQVIQISGIRQNFDLLHIDDCVDAFVLAIKRLTIRRNSYSHLTDAPRSSLEIFNIGSESEISVSKLVDMIVRYTRSKSPIRTIPGDDRFPHTYRGSTDKAARTLGFQPTVTPEEGFLRLVQSRMEQTSQALDQQITTRCTPDTPSNISIVQQLDGCTALLAVDVQGELAGVTASTEGVWRATSEVNLPSIKTFVTTPDVGKLLIRFQFTENDTWLGVASVVEGSIGLLGVTAADVELGSMVDWEMQIHPKGNRFKLVLNGTYYQLAGPTSVGGKFSLVSKEDDIWPFRVSPVCCPSTSAPWPFLADDPHDFMTDFQRTSPDRPFLASPRTALCSRLKQAKTKITRDLATLSIDTLQEARRPMSTLPSQWVNADLPACSNLCDLPGTCVDTADCQCVLSSCPSEQVEGRRDTPSASLVSRVNKMPWASVLRPQAARFVASGVPLPKIHIELRPQEATQRSNRDELQVEQCRSMETAVAAMGSKQDEADLTFLQLGSEVVTEESFRYQYDEIRDNTPNFDPTKVIVPFTKPYGQCFASASSDIWEVRAQASRSRNGYMKSATAWTISGDLSVPCYRSHQDVVIPSRNCESEALYEAFENITDVRPASERTVLASYHDPALPTFKITVQKLACRRVMKDVPIKTLWNTLGDYPSRIALLNDTLFCPQLPGTEDWLAESLYAGCIPVFIGHNSQPPFFDMIDWSKISVQLEHHELDRVEEILFTRFTNEEIDRLQANILLIRDAFVYKDSDTDPLWFALQSTAMRMATKWPSAY